jgi:ABC-type antimicrobial peptide transport system permease subunit
MPLTDYVAASLFGQRVAASLLSVLGVVALLLAAVGLYSVMAYTISQRTHEIGIRMAIGADPGHVMGLVIRQGMRFVLAGLVVGSIGAVALARLASSALIAVGPADPVVYAGVVLFLLLVALLATWIPARRALRVDPMASLRCQ